MRPQLGKSKGGLYYFENDSFHRHDTCEESSTTHVSAAISTEQSTEPVYYSVNKSQVMAAWTWKFTGQNDESCLTNA